jgi:hypothetical protein
MLAHGERAASNKQHSNDGTDLITVYAGSNNSRFVTVLGISRDF